MEPLTLDLRHGDEETIECWDDDGDLQFNGDIQLRTASSATSITNSSIRRSGHRDSISSRLSARSDLESSAGGDEDWQVQLYENDDVVNEEAIASAKTAGIPLPANVPKSALIGGTIKRLGRKKPKKNFIDDWSEDVEFPGPEGTLELKTPKDTAFPETLRQIGSAAASPVKASPSPFWGDDMPSRLHSTLTALNKFRDNDDEDDMGFEDVPTIKVAKPRSLQKAAPIKEFKPDNVQHEMENFDEDFELPADSSPLQLSSRKANTRIASPTPDEFDEDWCEGSIGVRFGGTTRDRRSNPSSTISMVSPSASSCLTGESEDDGLDGLIIPDGPLDLGKPLKQQETKPKAPGLSKPVQAQQEPANTEDFFSGLEIDGDDVFTSGKLSLNPNVKCKTERPQSPVRRSATTITFTNNAVSPKTRIPRLSGHNHDRPHSTHLETVSESGAPLSTFRRSQSRLAGHSTHASVSSLPSGPKSTSPTPVTPGRRLVGTRLSKDTLAGERAPIGKQLLKSKRSMPAMRSVHQATSIPSLHSSPPRKDANRPFVPTSRPKTPVDRVGTDTRTPNRRTPAPFIPAGASQNQSHHVTVKSYRHSRRTNSDGTGDTFHSQAATTRLSRSSRSEPFNSFPNDMSPDSLPSTAKRTITRPTRRRNFGDGTELQSFDDLPTSSTAESKYVKNPSGRGAPRTIRNRFSRSQTMSPQTDASAQPPTPVSLPKPHESTPRFARDTNASRNAREQRIASMTMSLRNRESNPLASLNSNWKNQTISRIPSTSSVRSKKGKSTGSINNKPHLIKPMGTGVQESKSVNGMRYNPATFLWEGNENLVQDFDTTIPKSPKPAPALITNVGAMQNVQVVGGMVFDPQRMCWLKLAPQQPGSNGVVAIQDDDDVFAGLDDLEENPLSITPCARNSGAFDDLGLVASGDDRSAGESSDEWPITEEFDVGPEFIKRQRAEEEKWRRKVDKWISSDQRSIADDWRWTIRDLVKFDSAFGAQRSNDN